MPDEHTDQILIERVAAGDRAAFAELFGRYQRLILNIAYRYLGRHDEAEEVVQETFMRLFRHVRQFDESRPLRPWLVQIAINACRTHGKRGARHPRQASEHALSTVTAATRPPTATVEAAEATATVRRAIAELPEPFRAVFVLASHDELDYPSIAQILGIPVGTVKSRMYRAIRQLRRKLEGLLP